MKLLLDTHILLWFIAGSSSLSDAARTLIENTENKKFVSIVRIWETAIKVSIGYMVKGVNGLRKCKGPNRDPGRSQISIRKGPRILQKHMFRFSAKSQRSVR